MYNHLSVEQPLPLPLDSPPTELESVPEVKRVKIFPPSPVELPHCPSLSPPPIFSVRLSIDGSSIAEMELVMDAGATVQQTAGTLFVECLVHCIQYSLEQTHGSECMHPVPCWKLSKENGDSVKSAHGWLQRRQRPYWKLASPAVRIEASRALMRAGSSYSLACAQKSTFLLTSDAECWRREAASHTFKLRIEACKNSTRGEGGRRKMKK